jgi:hypothetical protein
MTDFLCPFSPKKGGTMNTIENKQLLYKYLQRYLIKEKNISEQQAKQKALDLIKKNKNTLFEYGGLAWWLGQKSLEYFCLMWLQDICFLQEKFPHFCKNFSPGTGGEILCQPQQL